MSSSDPSHYRQSPSPQAIPLRDLNRPPDENESHAPGAAQPHQRTLSDRGRNLLRQSASIATGQHWNSQYAPIAEASPSPTRSSNRPQLQTSLSTDHRTPQDPEDGAYSPLEDAGAFQAAIGFSGFPDMGFHGETSLPIPTPMSSETSYQPYPTDPYLSRQESEDQGYFPASSYEDTARLTDSRNLQPISGVTPTATSPHRDRAGSFQSVRFLTPEATTPVSKSGDDIGYLEAASRRESSARKRSLSPGDVSPLHRAGTIVRNMSQRVVNISSEPDIAERTMRRKSSLRHARLQEPPSLPVFPEYAHNDATAPKSPMEKPPSPIDFKRPSVPWQRPPNPLRGRTLGIFSPENKLRLWLCDLLVHPVTEPLLLVLIIIQTVLLAVDASQDVFKHPRSTRWGETWIDKALLALFIIYTIEVFVRVIVSGFIINPVEYSTINRQVGLREAVMNKARQFLGPQRQSSIKKADPNLDPQQPSVLRTFTTAQMNPSIGPGDARQQQRVRLAHRAYLRHSFNRTDFLAVISFWIAFALSEFGFEQQRHIYIFRMLSCLRIIRLLNLTSGTSVSTKFLVVVALLTLIR